MAAVSRGGSARDYRLYIDGRWSEAAGGETYDVVNPATEQVIARAPNGSTADLQRAIEAARRAFDEGPWRRTSPLDRSRLLERLAQALEKRKEELRELLVTMAAAEFIGLPIQLDMPFELLANYADLARRYEFEQMLPVLVSQTPMGTQVEQLDGVSSAGRRVRAHPDLELPVLRHHPEDRPGSGRGLHHGVQAVAVRCR